MARDEIISILNKYKIAKEDKIAIAVSGGADSMFLLDFLFENEYNIISLHLNHNLREDSVKDQLIVEKFCQKNNIEYKIFNWDGMWKKNLEAHARKIRYELFLNYCNEHKIKYLLTAHHANDQVETFFMNLERGSGINGLSGIGEINQINGIFLIRPMLNIFKDQCLEYLLVRKISFAIDESNNDTKFKRNKLRLILEKFSDQNLNNRILTAIKHLKSTRKIENEYINKIWNIIATVEEFSISIPIDLFENQDKYIQISILSKSIQYLNKDQKKPRLKQLHMIINEIKNRHIKCKKIHNIYLKLNKKTFIFFLDN